MDSVRVRVYADGQCTEAAPADLPAILQQNQTVWVDITGPDADGLAVLRDVFGFHPLAIEDTMNHRQRPKVEEYENNLFVITNPVVAGEVGSFRELDLFLGRNFIVSCHEEAEPVIDEARRRVGTRITGPNVSSSYLFYVIVDVVVDGYFPMLEASADMLDAIEDDILSGPDKDSLEQLVQAKRQIRQIARVINPQRDMFNVLTRRDLAYVNHDDLQFYFRDVYDHLLRINDMIGAQRDTITGAEDLSMSAFSNRLGVIVNRLTVVTILTGVVSAIGGFYGMNFEYIWPPHEAIWGVPVTLVLMIAAVTALLLLFRRLGWFR